MNEQELLAQLRDVRMPDSPGWWPPAIGWWVVAALLLLLTISALWGLRHWRANAWRRVALREHRSLADNPGDISHALRGLSVLMRKVAMKVEPRHEVASATDEQWLNTLDRIGQTREYSEGVGNLLVVWPYRNPAADTDLSADRIASLLRLTRQTITRASAAPAAMPDSGSSTVDSPKGAASISGSAGGNSV